MQSKKIVSAEKLVEEIKCGKKVILIDHNDRENEGDVVIAAEKASPQDINFMMKNCRGVLCLCITEETQERLKLEMMPRRNLCGDSANTANFTVSIEAAKNISTGVSAYDRCTTIAAAIDPKSTPADICTPGHVFPLVAAKGGLASRKGHTEASVAVAFLAGLLPAAVISEVIRDDGQMARLEDLIPFAEKHDISIGFIEDLVKHMETKKLFATT